MRRAARALVLAALIAALPGRAETKAPAPGFFPSQEKPAPPPAPEEKEKPAGKDGPPKLPTVDEALEKLDLRARVAQLMLVTLQGGIAPNMQDVKYLREYTPGGAIVRQAGLPSEAQLYVAHIRASAGGAMPVLVGCDLYALARADRGLPSQFVQLPSLLSLAAAHDSGATDKFAHLLAEHMRGMGFDLSLGPSLELAPVIHDARGAINTFGSNPEFAASAGATVLDALEAAGVAAAPMGFPGGGANRRPKEPAVLLTTREELPQSDLLPYARAIEHGVRVVHIGNTLVPTLDKSAPPACTSPEVYALLREQLKFDGLVIAGPLDSEDVTAQLDAAEAARRALISGADLLYLVTPLNTAARVVDKLTEAVEAGTLPREIVDRAARRVIAFKLERAAKQLEPIVAKDAKKLDSQKALLEESYAVERKSITLIKNANGVLPLARERSTPTGITGVVGTEVLVELLRKPLKHVAEQPIGTAKHLGEIQDFEIERLTSHAEGLNTAIVILTDSLRPYGQRKLVSGLKAKGAKVVVVLLGYPGNAAELQQADAIILAYCDAATYGATLRAVADVLLGEPAIVLRNDLGPMQVKAGEARHFNALDIVRAPAGRLPVALGEAFPEGMSVNYGGDALAKSAEWEFGDGGHAKGLQTDYTYAAPGDYTLTVRVHSNKDESAAQSYRVSVTR